MTPQEKLKAKLQGAADQTKAVTGGGGEYTPPAKGRAAARFVGYFEVGEHEEDVFAGVPPRPTGAKRFRAKVDLVFELFGKNYPARVNEETGEVFPVRITVKETLSLNEKANFYKLFAQMNYAAKATHMAELLGDPFIVEIFHKESKDGKVFANLKGPNGYHITGPSITDPITDTTTAVPVPEARIPIKYFLWDSSDKEDWDALFIAGEYPERKDEKTGNVYPARSKNVLQNRIKASRNFKNTALFAEINAGKSLDLPDAEYPERTPTIDGEFDDDIPF